MTYIEQAIKEAVDHGYEPNVERYPEMEGISPLQIAIAMQADVFIDPAFWKALGKKRGWTTDDDFKYWQKSVAEWEDKVLEEILAPVHRPFGGGQGSGKFLQSTRFAAAAAAGQPSLTSTVRRAGTPPSHSPAGLLSYFAAIVLTESHRPSPRRRCHATPRAALPASAPR